MTRKLTRKEVEVSKKREYQRKTTATVFEVRNTDSEHLTNLINEFNEYSSPNGRNVVEEGNAYIITEKGYNADKSEDPVLRVVPPNQLWAIDYKTRIASELVARDLHFDYKDHEISRRDLCIKHELSPLEL